jgi:hypothetical protein
MRRVLTKYKFLTTDVYSVAHDRRLLHYTLIIPLWLHAQSKFQITSLLEPERSLTNNCQPSAIVVWRRVA